eukprot:g13724.t1
MKKPTAQEIKRRIDSKIFELQSSLLSEDASAVDEALLRECAAWFRPQHLQDIVIERSEAEGRCGWPGCGKKLPPWRLAAPLVFDLPEGEQLGRFCERACMAKTNIYLAAIPPTPPDSRENLVRIVCPPPTGPSVDASNASGAAGAMEVGAKKVYKRPRRRDIPPSKKAPAGSSPAAAAAPKTRSGKDMTADRLPGGGVARGDQVAEAAAVNCPPVHGDDKVQVDKTDEDQVEQTMGKKPAGAGLATEVGATTAAIVANGGGGDGGGGGAREGAGKSTISESRGGEDESDADSTAAVVRAALQKVSICDHEGCESSVVTSAATVGDEGAAPGPSVLSAIATGAATAAAPSPAALVPPLAPAAPSTDWGNLRLSRTIGGGASSSSSPTSSVVSLHASLAAAAAEAAAAAANPNVSAPASAAAPAACAGAVINIASGSEEPRVGDAKTAAAAAANGHNPGVPRENSQSSSSAAAAGPEAVGPSPARRKSVSFANGGGCCGSGGNRTGATGKGTNTGEGEEGGRGSGRVSAACRGGGRGKGAPAEPVAALKKIVLGGVVERAPAVPTPIEPEVGGRASAGMVEGHLPKIEADLSFRVVPRGGYPGLGGDVAGAGGESSLGDHELGGDGGPLTGDEIEDETEEEEEEEEKEEEEEGGGEEGGGGGEGGANENEADENDRAIWRETFGEEMPADVAADSWIDMSAVRDKEMREEFAASIAPSALLWSALSEWATAETRAVCRAGRSAAAKVQAAAAAAAAAAAPEAMPAVTAENGGGKDVGSSSSNNNNSSSGHDHNQDRRGSVPADFQARKAGAVAEAIETEARRHARRDRGRVKNGGKFDKEAGSNSHVSGGDDGGRGEGPTLTGALRHSGVSAMVNMHLLQAERALRTAAATTTTGGGGGGRRRLPGAIGGNDTAGSRTNWVWSDKAAKARQGARGPRGWVEEEEAAAMAALAAAAEPIGPVAATKQDTNNNNGNVAVAAAPPPPLAAQETATEATRGRTEGAGKKKGRGAEENEDLTVPPVPAAAATAAAVTDPVPVGGAGCRRAVAALIDTLDVRSASAVAALSIAQWKVVSLVLLTAVGLGAGAVGQGAGDTAGGGVGAGAGAGAWAGGDVSGCGEAGVGAVGSEEAAGGAEACVRLCGPEMSLSASEFRILVEVMLDE